MDAAIFRGRDSFLCGEPRGEMAAAAESELLADFCDTQSGAGEEHLRPGNPLIQNVF